MTESKAKTTDMTQGSPLRHILLFAVPILVGNLFQQVYNVVDTMVAGYNLGDDAIAAIGATAALYSLLIDLAFGLNNGYGIVISQSFGGGDIRRIRGSIAGTMVLNVSASVLCTAVALYFLRPMMELMNTPEAVFEQAWLYIVIICCGLVTTNGYNMLTSILRALGNSRTPLYFLIISSVLNIVLDVVLVAGFHTGIAGAAAATVAAQTVSGILCAALFLRDYREYLPRAEDFRLSRQDFSELFFSGLSMGMMYCVVDIGSVIFTSANNLLGESIITSHIAARRLIMMMNQPLGAFAAANATFTGQNWGAGKRQRIRSTLRQVLTIEVVWGLASWLFLEVFGGMLIQLTTGTTNPEIIQNGILSLRFHGSCCWELGLLLSLRTAMQAMGHKWAPLTASAMEMGMKLVAAWYFIPKYGFLATCATEPATWIACMLFLVVVYFAVNRKELLMGDML